MTITGPEPKRAPIRSTAASIGLHALLALAIPSFAWTVASSPEIETISFMKITTVHVATPTPPPAVRPPAAAPVVAPAIHLAPSTARPVEISRHSNLQVQRRPDVQSTLQSAPQAAPQVQGVAPVAQTAATAVPQATPAVEQQRQVASVAHKAVDGGYLPLGAEQDVPVLDPTVRTAIAQLGVHTTLTVVVDADGKVKSIAFTPDVDTAVETKIRSMLAAAQWDAAVCGGGVSCEGKAVLKF